MKSLCLGLVAIATALAVTAGSGSAGTITLPRPGQVGFTFQGEGGALTKSGEFGRLFDVGGGYAVRLRYRMRYERGLGLSFEHQTFGAREEARVDTMPERLMLTTASLEFYQMFGTRTRTVKMLSAGIGLAQARQTLKDDETVFSGEGAGDGLLLSLGAGLERFVYQSWAVDLSTRYHGIIHNGKLNHDVQFAIGMTFYAAY